MALRKNHAAVFITKRPHSFRFFSSEMYSGNVLRVEMALRRLRSLLYRRRSRRASAMSPAVASRGKISTKRPMTDGRSRYSTSVVVRSDSFAK